MLDITKLEAGEYKVNATTYDIWESITSVVFGAEQRLEANNIQISGFAPTKTLVLADQDLVYQVIYNLVDNAIKFCNVGGEIRFSVTQSKGAVTVGVRNTGAGIAPEALPYVFDRFYKEDKSRGLNTTGSGLGLHICKVLINLSGGKIWVDSKEGEYCEFLFTLPAPPSSPIKGGQAQGSVTTAPHEAWKRNIRGRQCCALPGRPGRERGNHGSAPVSAISAAARRALPALCTTARDGVSALSALWRTGLRRPALWRPRLRAGRRPRAAAGAPICISDARLDAGRPRRETAPAGAGTVRRWWLFCFAWGLPPPFFWRERLLDALRSGGAARRRPTPGEVPSFTIEDLPEDADGGLSTVEIAKTVGPSVVCINVYEPGSISIAGSGSGIILNEDGFIVTNAHVVEGSSAVTVLLDDGRELDAWIVGSDTRTDLAVVKITADGWCPPPSEIRTSCRWASGPWRSAMRPDSSPAPSPRASSPASIVRSACRRATASSR